MMKTFGKILLGIFMILICALGILGWMGYDGYQKALDTQSLSSKVSMIQNQEDYMNLDDLPEFYLDAVVAVEDHDFYHHGGVDIGAVGRAILTNIKEMALVEGGSTITQQLAKNLYFSQDKNFVRKISETFMAWDLERTYSKDEILELYVNSIYFGDGYYGIKQASLGYYGIMPDQLTEAQCVILAGIPNAPSVYSLTNNKDLAKQRALQVVGQMLKYDVIDQKKAYEVSENVQLQ